MKPKMQEAETQEDRDIYLTNLSAIMESPSLADRGELLKEAAWARGLFSSATTAQMRVSFALEVDAVERINFASDFRRLSFDGVPWSSLRCATSFMDVPKGLPWSDFREMLELVDNSTCRQWITNPLVAALVDFRSDIRAAGCGALECFEPLLRSVVASKMGVPMWQPETEFHLEDAPQEHWQPIVKALNRLFAARPPQWVAIARDRRAGAASGAAAAAKAPGAPADPDSTATAAAAAAQAPASGAQVPASEAAAAAAAQAPASAAQSPASPSAAAPAAAASPAWDAAVAAALASGSTLADAQRLGRAATDKGGGKQKEGTAHRFVVGDVVLLGDTVGKQYINLEFGISSHSLFSQSSLPVPPPKKKTEAQQIVLAFLFFFSEGLLRWKA